MASIRWLSQALGAQPGLAEGIPPDGLLDRQEEEQLKRLCFEKRRRDWLLGRYTSKLLLQAIVWEEGGEYVPWQDLAIRAGEDGAPFATWQARFGELPISLSISHSGDRAFCAAVGLASWGHPEFGLLGADIERIEARSPAFVQDFFSETERGMLESVPAPSRDLLITATWSAKEASLKALHLGLQVDARSAICWIAPQAESPESWSSFSVQWDVRRLNRPVQHQAARAGEARPELAGWWRISEGYVLTLAAPDELRPAGHPVSLT